MPQDRDVLLRFVNDIFHPSPGAIATADSPAAASQEEHSGSIDASEVVNAEQGLDVFNRAVRDTVPRHMSISGIRKFKILSYVVAVLVPLHFYWSLDSNDPLYMFDRWAFSYAVVPEKI